MLGPGKGNTSLWERLENGDWLVSGIQHQRGSMSRFEKSHSTTIFHNLFYSTIMRNEVPELTYKSRRARRDTKGMLKSGLYAYLVPYPAECLHASNVLGRTLAHIHFHRMWRWYLSHCR